MATIKLSPQEKKYLLFLAGYYDQQDDEIFIQDIPGYDEVGEDNMMKTLERFNRYNLIEWAMNKSIKIPASIISIAQQLSDYTSSFSSQELEVIQLLATYYDQEDDHISVESLPHYDELRRHEINKIVDRFERLGLVKWKTNASFLIYPTILDIVQQFTNQELSPSVPTTASEASDQKENMATIFLCYAREDQVQVEDVYRRLRDAGFQPWMDKKDLLLGQEWEREIPRQLRASEFVLVFLSQNSIAKRGYIQREFKLALDTLEEIPGGRIHTLPVRLDDCDVPEEFRRLQWGNLFEEDDFTQILRALRSGMSQRQPSTLKLPLTVRPFRNAIPRITPAASIIASATLCS